MPKKMSLLVKFQRRCGDATVLWSLDVVLSSCDVVTTGARNFRLSRPPFANMNI